MGLNCDSFPTQLWWDNQLHNSYLIEGTYLACSNFINIFDVDWFISSLAKDVTIVKRVPDKVMRSMEKPPYTMRVPRKSAPEYYLDQVLPILLRRRVRPLAQFVINVFFFFLLELIIYMHNQSLSAFKDRKSCVFWWNENAFNPLKLSIQHSGILVALYLILIGFLFGSLNSFVDLVMVCCSWGN